MQGPTQNLDPIDSAVLTLIGYKKANKHTESQAKYINRYIMRKYLQTIPF